MPGLLDTPTAIPRVETERLMLRGHRLDDLDACAAMWGDAEVARYIGGKAFGRDEVWMRLLRYVGHWALLGYGFWVIEEKASGRFVGEVGLGDFMRDLNPPLGAVPEAGWVLAPWAHRRGFATEAVRAALKWGASHLGASRTVCIISPENVPSLRVAEKCGYREFRRTTYKGQPTILLER
jgi:RimJ/RimL family protein N-acetyltransferase